MPKPKLRLLITAAAAALYAVPACDDDPEGSAFSDTGGSAGSARGGSGSAGEATSGGSAGEAPATAGSTSGGESNAGGHAGTGSGEAGGSSSGQGGGAGEPSTPGGGGSPGAGWYCNPLANGCVCVQEPGEYGECAPFDCCYTYDGGPAGLACTCSDLSDAACDAEVENDEGTRVEFCPP
ncbi:MAG TPA: hypothetical protein VM686_29735 [Polyangiaceae bacterium]|nr:hypothetical protein [Polyangiaceae bacterium]